jgi:hypothetical protein
MTGSLRSIGTSGHLLKCYGRFRNSGTEAFRVKEQEMRIPRTPCCWYAVRFTSDMWRCDAETCRRSWTRIPHATTLQWRGWPWHWALEIQVNYPSIRGAGSWLINRLRLDPSLSNRCITSQVHVSLHTCYTLARRLTSRRSSTYINVSSFQFNSCQSLRLRCSLRATIHTASETKNNKNMDRLRGQRQFSRCGS